MSVDNSLMIQYTVQFNETKKTHYNLQLLLSIVGLLLILQIIVVCIIVRSFSIINKINVA